MRFGRQDGANQMRPLCVQEHAMPSFTDLDFHDRLHQVVPAQYEFDHADRPAALGIQDGHGDIQKIEAPTVFIDVADVCASSSLCEGFPPPDLISMTKTGVPIEARDQR